jgi:energy-coupling factor transporter ATP-binding protein EcfA2
VSSDLAFALRGVGTAVGGNFALRDVSFELPTGYVMGLIGANGAGKTTTIRCLLGMRGFETGEIELLGHPVPGHHPAAGAGHPGRPPVASHLTITPVQLWLPLVWAAGLAAIVTSAAVAITADQRRARSRRPARDDRTSRDQYPKQRAPHRLRRWLLEGPIYRR